MSDERRHECTHGRYGWIPDLDLPTPSPTPAGDYLLFLYSEAGGGGIRHTGLGRGAPIDSNRSRRDTQAAYEAALAAGAESVRAPTKVMDGVCTALVRAPGGVLIGFSEPTD